MTFNQAKLREAKGKGKKTLLIKRDLLKRKRNVQLNLRQRRAVRDLATPDK